MSDTQSQTDDLRAQIRTLVADYHDAAFAPRPFVPGVSPVPVAGRVFDAEDIQALMEATLDFWLTTGRFAASLKRHSPNISASAPPPW